MGGSEGGLPPLLLGHQRCHGAEEQAGEPRPQAEEEEDDGEAQGPDEGGHPREVVDGGEGGRHATQKHL